MDGPGSNPVGGEIFRTCPYRLWGPTSLLYNGYRVFTGVKSGRSLTLTPHPLLVPWSRKSRAIPLILLCVVRPVQNLSACTTVHFTFTYTSTPPMGRTACTEPQCLYKGALYLYLYLYSSCGPYGLYSTEPQCLYKGALYLYLYLYSPCGPYGLYSTEPQCLYKGALYLYLYLYSPYEPYGLYRASVPVQRCALPLPLPLPFLRVFHFALSVSLHRYSV